MNVKMSIAAGLSLVVGLSAGAAEYMSVHALDAAKSRAEYDVVSAAAKEKSDAYAKAKRDWDSRRKKAEKAKQEFTEPAPVKDFKEVFDLYIFPEAENRADAEIAEPMKVFKEKLAAWNDADPKTRGHRPSQPSRKVKVEADDVVAMRATSAYREPLYGRIMFNPLRVTQDFAKTGSYRVWIRYWRNAGSPGQLAFRVIAPSKETCRFEILNRVPNVNDSPNREHRNVRTDDGAGWFWISADLNIEATGTYAIELTAFDRNVPTPVEYAGSPIAVRDVWISDDPKFNPEKGAKESVASVGEEKAPAGFVAARRHPTHANLNMAVRDSQKRLLTNIMESYGWYNDLPMLVQLGAVDTYSSGGRKDNAPLGMSFQQGVTSGRRGEKPPTVEIRDGEDWYAYRVRKNAYALSIAEESVKKALEQPDDDLLACWWTAWEECGSYDYGEESQKEFRLFLKTKHGSLSNLNKAWHTEYASFDEIVPAKWDEFYGANSLTNDLARHQQMANFVDFRDFRSKVYAMEIGVKTEAVVKHDTHGPNGGPRHVSSNLSANNVASVMWMRWRPLCFEDTAQITMKGSDMIGYDNYGTDDVMGAFYETFDSFGDGKLRPMVREGSIHAPQPEVYARTVWGNVAKGMRGMDTFVLHESGNRSRQGELQKFGLCNMYDDAAPRPKMAAVSDIYRAMHQLDHLLCETKRVRAAKPIAIYYSSICNLLQERPYASIFDPGPDNFFRVYELIHANGYPVTFVTDRQIREGGEWFKNLKAIVFVDATYIPTDVQQKVMDWVEQGGHVFADAQSGTRDGYTFPTDEFTKWLGIRPVQQKKIAKDAAAKLSFGYSAYSFDVIQRDELYKSSCEVKDAPGCEHPIAKMLGKTMISAMGYNEIQCTDGWVVLQENNSRPYMTVRDHGTGSSVYFAGYAGTMFGAGCTQYEWRDKHADNSPYRVMDAWLKWIGAEKIAENDLPRDMRYSMRFESPLVDARGNAFMGIVSQLPGDVPSFRVKYLMPTGFKTPKMCLATVNGSRRIVRVPFAYDERTRELSARMPGFAVWGNLIALNDLEPLVSVEFAADTKRDAYALADVRPGDELVAKVRVFNPSDRELTDGEVQLRLPYGWFYDRETANVAKVAAQSESDEMTFRIKAPAVNCSRRLKAINFVYNHKSLPNGSGPAVEMVWFPKEPQNAPAQTIGVK